MKPIIPEAALEQHTAVLGRAAPTTRPSDTDKAYAAGFFDGEGNVSIAINSKAGGAGHDVYNMRVGAAQCDPSPLVWMRDRWGGSIARKTRGPCLYYHWACFARMAAAFLTDVLPYLQVKRERAQLAIKFQSTVFQPGRRAHTENYRSNRTAMKVEMNRLNAL